MAHFAQLNDQNVVVQVLVVSNDDIRGLPFPESEPVGIAFLNGLFPDQTLTWKQTSYNGNFRRKYAGIGDTFNSEHDGFVSPMPPFLELTFDFVAWDWVPAIPKPTDGYEYYWDYPDHKWVKIVPVTVIG
jgi:hypothetical protein